jgi:phosphoribosyl-ATP pyrophosphohydrolase
MDDVIKGLYEVITSRRESADESSYTAYLFREGLDKILKKIGEESSETIIAAKSLEAARARATEAPETSARATGHPTNAADSIDDRRADLANEVADLIYHILVMLVERGLTWDEIEDVLAERAHKTGNLKPRRAPHSEADAGP